MHSLLTVHHVITHPVCCSTVGFIRPRLASLRQRFWFGLSNARHAPGCWNMLLVRLVRGGRHLQVSGGGGLGEAFQQLARKSI
jgi:hypothetical protein